MGAFSLRVEFDDRTGMVHDASQIILRYNISIVTLEVLPNLMYFELECNDEYIKKRIMLDMAAIPNIKKVEEVKYINHEIINDDSFNTILGESKIIKKAILRAKLAAESNSTVLLLGESGTGKELFAKAIHQSSKRRNRCLYAVNCAALPDTLLESELFGYEDGAFSGAKKGGKSGLLEIADKSTVFFDEIGDLSLGTQAKLLRFLQEMKIRRIGGYGEKSVDIRFIAATNHDLEKQVENGGFREDLYYRINVIPITIPTLRERRADIPLLAEHFLLQYSKKAEKPQKTLTASAMAGLVNYNWPGNVRELQNVIERAVNLTTERIIDSNSLFLEEKDQILFTFGERKTLRYMVEQVEKRAIADALEKNSSIRKAAKELGISHTALIKKINKYEDMKSGN